MDGNKRTGGLITRMNPYAPPAAATRVQRPYARFKRLSYAATACGSACAVLIALHTRSMMLGAATVCASLMLCFLQASTLAWLSQQSKEGGEP